MKLTAHPGAPLRGEVAVPGDKSISHRALIIGAMAEGETRITGLLESDDVMRTVAAVRALGADVARDGDIWRVRGGPWRSPDAPIDCGNSGTTARLLMGAVAGRPISATFVGDSSLSRRPMRRVTEPLRQMGARIEGGDTLPITVHGGRLRGIEYAMPVASAQVKSAILLAGLGADGPTRVIETQPSRDHSERMLPLFLDEAGRLRGTDVPAPGDPSSAAFLVVAALLVPGSQVTVRGVGINPTRIGLFETLRDMGGEIELANRREVGGEPVADVLARASRLRGVEVPAARAPAMIDEYPLLAVAAAFAQGGTAMHDLGELRHKESDRLAAIANGLAACGVSVQVEGDTLRIRGGAAPGGTEVAAHGDHRIAMAFAVLGLASAAPVCVDGAEMIATSFPGFADLMRGLGARIEDA
ncbi:3-phosphoshikimate 1-carboxyvinyltransferase [Sphingosinicella sp. YJ22]|uniref:3-phosphoshikimate 1-carboxyvinyltransferase n=1 Tax=Sphingosinicella sp. YJ22 TaxID=1104780 RepID=UPI0014094C6A|nr:3-phosphoshikimate 1-carboxyvinyltransferase [Sphingosinicella sp. YJ22]